MHKEKSKKKMKAHKIMDLSKQNQVESKKLNVPIQYPVMADLLAIGYSDDDAYAILFQETTFDVLDIVKH